MTSNDYVSEHGVVPSIAFSHLDVDVCIGLAVICIHAFGHMFRVYYPSYLSSPDGIVVNGDGNVYSHCSFRDTYLF